MYVEVLHILRTAFRSITCLILVLALASAWGITASAGPAQEMLPEQSAAKARQLLQRVIAALGGQAYLNVRNTQCDGRIAQFGTAGTLMGFSYYRDYWLLPDKHRVEYISKGEHSVLAFLLGSDTLMISHGGELVTILNGNEGWTLDKGGVTNEPDDVIQAFEEQVKTGMDNMLRRHMNDPGVDVQYGGPDLIDMKESEWIEFTDSEHHEMRLGVDKFSHLPLRWVVATRNPETRERTEMTTSLTQYFVIDGVKSPLSLEQYRGDRKLTQTFLTNCQYNADLDPQFFTRAWLEQHAAEIIKKGYKDTKSTK